MLCISQRGMRPPLPCNGTRPSCPCIRVVMGVMGAQKNSCQISRAPIRRNVASSPSAWSPESLPYYVLLAISFRRLLGRGAARPPSTIHSIRFHHRFRLCLIVMIAVVIAIAASAAIIVPSCEISVRGLRARIRSACPRSALASGRTPWETRKKQCSPWSLLTAGGGRSSHWNLGPPRKRHGCAGPPKARAAPPRSRGARATLRADPPGRLRRPIGSRDGDRLPSSSVSTNPGGKSGASRGT